MEGGRLENRQIEEALIIQRVSTATVTEFDESNKKLFLDSLAALDPDLWLIRTYLDRYKVNPALIPVYIEHLSKIHDGSGWGKIVTEIRDHKVIFCEGTDSRLLDLEIKV